MEKFSFRPRHGAKRSHVLPAKNGALCRSTSCCVCLKKMRRNALWLLRPTPADPPVRCLGGTPKGRRNKLGQAFLGKPWASARGQVRVKLLAQGEEMEMLAHSQARADKERAMRRRRLKQLPARLHELGKQKPTHDELLMKLGAARTQAGRACALVQIEIPKRDARDNARALMQRFRFGLDRAKLREVRKPHRARSGQVVGFSIRLTEVEQAFKELKSDLAVRPITREISALRRTSSWRL
jgi:hypothetical protein